MQFVIRYRCSFQETDDSDSWIFGLESQRWQERMWLIGIAQVDWKDMKALQQ